MEKVIGIFVIDNVNILFAITGILITFLAIFFARSQMVSHYKKYCFLVVVYVLSFLVTIFTKDWLVFFLAWEMVTITTSLMLVWSDKGLAGQYFIIQFIGSSILLYVILLAINNGYNEIMPVEETWLQNLFVIGLGMKSSIIGLHFWLPPIYSQASVIFNAISSGWVIKLGFITLLKLINNSNHLLMFTGSAMIFYGGLKALQMKDYKVLLAYSSISQLGYIAIGIGCGTIYGYLGSIFYIIAHGLAKTGLFLGCGSIIKEYGAGCIYHFRQIWDRQKLISISILVCFASLLGFPFLAGFTGKHIIKYGLKNNMPLTVILYAGSLLTCLYIVRFLYWGIFKDLIERKKNINKKGSGPVHSKIGDISFIVIITLLVSIGLFSGSIIKYLQEINIPGGAIKGYIEVVIFLLFSIIILYKYNWIKRENINCLSLDLFYKRINKRLYKIGRYLYDIIYQDFQYQLLSVPLFMIILFLFHIFG